MPTLLPAQTRTGTASRPFTGMLVAIDARVEAHQMLAQGVLPGTKVITIDPDQDGVEIITTTPDRLSRNQPAHRLSRRTGVLAPGENTPACG
jgi:hypothetical protein